MADAGFDVSAAAAPLDVMNDAAFDQNTKSQDQARADADTCRICRSEGTAEEPLFYPCKCSGSIKHVHQECLMEWLSHTNKKHCELCKTPFRFTKLYDPHMPDSLPISVFISRAFLHVSAYILTWLRAVVVALIWLVIMPWAIRWAWRGLFFFMDVGWARDPWILKMADQANSTTTMALPVSQMESSPSQDNLTVMGVLVAAWEGLKMAARPWKTTDWQGSANSLRDYLLNATSHAAESTLLTDVSAVNNLTDSRFANRVILDIMEGLIITIVAVVAFILIFLIREWVIQQQPILNAAAHVREAEQQLDRVEQARQRLRDEIRVVEHQLERLNNPMAYTQEGEPLAATDAHPSTATGPPQTATQRLAPVPVLRNMPHRVDWSAFERRIKDATERWKANEDQPRSTEDVTLAEKLTDEVVQIIQDTQNGDNSDIEAFGVLISWVKKIPPEINSAWLSELAAVFAQLKSGQRTSPPSEVEASLSADAEASTASGGLDTPAASSMVSEDGVQLATSDGRIIAQEGEIQDPHPDHELEMWRRWQRSEAESASGIPANAPIANVSERALEASELGDTSSASHDMDDETSEPSEYADSQAVNVEAIEQSRPAEPSERLVDTGSAESLPDTPDAVQAPVVPEVIKQGIIERMYDYFWGEVEILPLPVEEAPLAVANGVDGDAQVVELVAPEGPLGLVPGEVAHDPEVIAAAEEAGLDAEAIEDAEDLEGLLELIGMQGPIGVLAQTAIFFGLLVSVTLWGAIGGPYLTGKLALQLLSDPILFFVIVPLRAISHAGDFLLDVATLLTGGFLHWSSAIVSQCLLVFGSSVKSVHMAEYVASFAEASRLAADRAATHLTGLFLVDSSPAGTDSHLLLASLQAHRSLLDLKHMFAFATDWAFSEVITLLHVPWSQVPSQVLSTVQFVAYYIFNDMRRDLHAVYEVLSSMVKGNMLTIPDRAPRPLDLDPLLSYWSGTDRALTISVGYAVFAAIGFLIAFRSEPMFSNPALQKAEKNFADILRQAGGVIKVILIISIEMLAFPLYCGMLLDLALMPLFQGVTLSSRIAYAQDRPYMFTFLHWFLGTAYMFNFALFVSMCRRILRSGVLYFIRDPDDPTFHPVRDVLERSIAGQLRKIAFSAFVYGLMVLICLGGIVWGIASSTNDVFPLRWSTPDPVLEFPMEFLLYNFISPFVFKMLQPSKGLEAVYDWWLRKCARRLRLSHFLFGVRNEDEESTRTAKGKDGSDKPMKDGRFVKVPASDQVRIQRGQRVFVPVTEQDVSNSEAEQDCDLHGRPNQRFRNVYVPPWFQTRIGLFLVGLWMLCAAIGLCFTVLPLVLGRAVFALALPDDVRPDDIWTIFLGVHMLLLPAFAAYRARGLAKQARKEVAAIDTSAIMKELRDANWKMLKCLYVYGFAMVFVPTMTALLLHLYAVIPLRTYTRSGIGSSMAPATSANPANIASLFPVPDHMKFTLSTAIPSQAEVNGPTFHAIYIFPDWTLGFVISRLISRVARSQLAISAFRQITRDGKFNPDARLATRAFVLPALLFAVLSTLLPLTLAAGLLHTILPTLWGRGLTKVDVTRVYRYSYPIVLGIVVAYCGAWGAKRAVKKWRGRIRDEVYLIGERLHNFGERKPPSGSKGIMKKGKEVVRNEDGVAVDAEQEVMAQGGV